MQRCKSLLWGRALPGPGGKKFVAPSKMTVLEGLVAMHGVDRVLAAIEAAPRDMVPGLLDAVVASLDFDGDPSSPGEREALVEHLRARRRMLDVLVATAVVEGDDDLVASHRQELAECENALKDLAEGAA